MACRNKMLYLPEKKSGCCVPVSFLAQIAEEGRNKKGPLLVRGGALVLGIVFITTILVASF